MLEHLSNPEYLHVLLNPLPVYGLAVGVLGLIIALISRARAARVTALAIVFVSTFAAWPVYRYGEAAYDRVLSMADNDGSKWLEEHQRRAEQLIYVFYAVATLAALGLLAERFAPRAAFPLTITTLLLATATLGTGGYIASAGGRIRHREFRYVPAPDEAKEHEN
jgi:hypothetical protein